MLITQAIVSRCLLSSMDNQSIKTRILADYQTLLTLKVDNPQLISDKFKLISEHLEQLTALSSEERQAYEKATTLIKSALTTEFVAFSEAVSQDDKEQALALLKHKASEACQLASIHG